MSTPTDTSRLHTSTRVCTALVLSLAFLTGACRSYPSRTKVAVAAFERGEFERSRELFADPETTGSEFLSGAEAGSSAFAAGNWEATLQEYGRAADEAQEIEDSALISAESLSDSLLAFTLSESVKEYVGEGYERVLLHAQMAIAYLAQGEFESARVEVRRSNALLESEEKLYEKEYQAGGLGHFLSALVYELQGSPDDAYIDYKRMAEKGIGGRLVGRSLVRLANLLGRQDELPSWEQTWGPDSELPAGAVEVVVVAAIGMGPRKEEFTLSIPTSSGILQWSVPTYRSRPGNTGGLELVVEGSGQAISSVVIEDVSKVAAENLEDRIAWLAARSAVRSVLKLQLTKQLNRRWEGVGFLAGSLFSVLTERADLRCWQTLPASFQAARVFLPPGVHSMRLRNVGGESQDLGLFELVPGETMFVFARTVGSRLYAHPVGGLLIDPAAPAAAADSLPPSATALEH